MKIIHYPDLRLRYYCQSKNASTAMEHYLAQLTTEERTYRYWDISTIRHKADWNPPRSDIERPEVDQAFTIIRNSWARMASVYNMLRDQLAGEGLHPWFDRYREPITSALTSPEPFKAFVRWAVSLDDEHVETHWQPQYIGLPFGDPKFHIIRLERLADDLAAAGGFLSTIDVSKLIRFNYTGSGEGAFRDLYDAETRDLVWHRYRKEIQLFGYQFEEAHPLFKEVDRATFDAFLADFRVYREPAEGGAIEHHDISQPRFYRSLVAIERGNKLLVLNDLGRRTLGDKLPLQGDE